jgi:hypothetical protein
LGRERLIERERRWARPAGIAALVPAVLYVVSILIDQSANLYTGASDAQQLRSLHDHSGAILASAVFRAIGFLALPVPLVYLFRAAQARNPRVQGALVGFAIIGPILFAVQGVVQSVGARQISSDFVSMPKQSQTYKQFQSQLRQDPGTLDKVTIYTEPNTLEVQGRNGSFYTVKRYPPKAEDKIPNQLDKANPSVDHETDTEGAPGDALARDLTENSTGVKVGQALLFPAVLGMVVALIYTPLQALRVGLLTRFAGTLGMALGASLILILPVALLAILLWTAYLGFLFLGRVPGGRPPAWDAGEAIPWPKPGDEESRAPPPSPDAIEGEANEVEASGEPAAAAPGGQPRSAKRKRKRRR